MERFDIETFDYKKNKGKLLHCVDLIYKKDETTLETYIAKTKKEAMKNIKELNKRNDDTNYKWQYNYCIVNDNELENY